MDAVLQHYEDRRSVEVLKIQNAARNSTEWFENVERYTGMPIEQFAYSLLTRSQRISHENLRLRDARWLEGYRGLDGRHLPRPMAGRRRCAAVTAAADAAAAAGARRTLKNRIVVSPMATYSAVDGVVQDFHLVHLGARALGGAALVMVEMTSPTPEGRITPGCTGLWNDAQQAGLHAHRRLRARPAARRQIGLQLGHSGPKGSTQVGWERHGRAAGQTGQLAAAGGQRRGLWRTEPDTGRDDPRRHGRA